MKDLTIDVLLAVGAALTSLAALMWVYIQPKITKAIDTKMEEERKSVDQKIREHSGACAAVRRAEDMAMKEEILERMDRKLEETRRQLERLVEKKSDEQTGAIKSLDATVKEMLLQRRERSDSARA